MKKKLKGKKRSYVEKEILFVPGKKKEKKKSFSGGVDGKSKKPKKQ